ncbi:MAG: HlyD family efflux transporter periplasmic adaptor subunit [Gammaproteobacteria bacterium]|nr:HlyD family efflux transporter periplasmic adaptor subunit [Gammaproteobacteria bacterium]MDE0247511.1 HlyD family efflux transporter periplasmic adaptor subunit [Gammaproteobacteria bacterium]
MKNRIRPLTLVLAAAAAGVWYLRGTQDDAASELQASGTVEATDADLGFQGAGRVLEVRVAEGATVEEGSELARLDARELNAALAAALAQLGAAEARLEELSRGSRPQELATAEAAMRSAARQADEAARQLERAQILHDGGAISRQDLDQAETRVELARAGRDQAEQALALVREGPRAEQVAVQRALVEQAEAHVARVSAALANTVIHAPFPGIVTVRHREPGEVVAPGMPVLTVLDPEDRWVRIYVPGDEIGRVRLGMPAEIVSDTYPDRAYPGEVVFIADEAEFTPRNVQTAEDRTRLVYAVRVRITRDPEFVLKPGIPADVTLVDTDR